jgi:hypothetical protein
MLAHLLSEVRVYIRGNDDWRFGSPRCEAVKRHDFSRALGPGRVGKAI